MGASGQALPIGSDSKDTIDSRVIPVIIVPGVMGTRLEIEGFGPDWDPNTATRMMGWLTRPRRAMVDRISMNHPANVMRALEDGDALKVFARKDVLGHPRLRELALASMKNPPKPVRGRPDTESESKDRVDRAIVQVYESRGWGELVWSFYGVILMDLQERLNAGQKAGELHPVYACGYDWRQTNSSSALRLMGRIDEVLVAHPLADQVIVVSHSMGGLVTRATLGVADAMSKIRGVVHTVIPADGAVVAYRRCFTGARPELGETEGNLNTILGETPLQYLLMQSVLQGPVELLPHDAYPEEWLLFKNGITNKFFSDVFAEYARQQPPGLVFNEAEIDTFTAPDLKITAADVANLKARLAAARVLSKSIAGKVHPKTFVLLGNQLRTDMNFDWNKAPFSRDGAAMGAMAIRRPEGDGTVPGPSARFDGGSIPADHESKFNVEHASCFSNAGFRNAVFERVHQLIAST